MHKLLPIGIDDFKELISNNYYYIDKTLFIKEILDRRGKVSLFTRPRRFGKTLNLSMLQHFLRIRNIHLTESRIKRFLKDWQLCRQGMSMQSIWENIQSYLCR